ncbi:undecaprenyldiphospho-muramoylpentapeptide beta-N-acetylglucosaminyltransferase [Egicoccus halophilus]|uniref:UDP-N-acetylglucosamine--N-acetylmuramyl-(pentapeptide) pyrophosphoryl-undecaprenol N-acetylglucosamine transferase n=1 Tax=Egicoccus halophilus TaxID=1670830 RepID=A0A8J3AD43_9ACTN|nr:undecaprenyldiphospho-muramoylpentapeptide beta-N-acetylglucosaminyltransferase [Egicoccus halophilus]GGI04327.1 UDP-N-acetylglucosamine--N-acetylmuramyl-(pentapeptide) pyrophosphoryl-undecaprenol N-acetylglucosamine transferase [Egicoccus halophilus]
MTTKVLVAGGGTAGHVFPAIAVAKELQRQADVEPVFVGVPDRLEARLVPPEGFRLHEIAAVSVPRRPSAALLRLPFALRASIRACERIARAERAAAVVTFGGYVSFPLDRAAKRLGLPLVVHEQNAVPGLTNRVAARWADRVAVTFPGSADRFPQPERVAVTGDPVREDILRLDRDAERPAAREAFGLEPDVPTLLVFGGSQGAASLNRAIVDAHARWGTDALQVLHAAGRSQHADATAAWDRVREGRPGLRVQVVDFIDDMARAYAAADLVVCRAGATSIAELTVLGLPAVLVPYPSATGDHQTANARALEQTGGALVVADADLDGASLVAAAEPLLTDPDHHARMAAASRAFGRPDAAANVARLVLEQLDRAPAGGHNDLEDPA